MQISVLSLVPIFVHSSKHLTDTFESEWSYCNYDFINLHFKKAEREKMK